MITHCTLLYTQVLPSFSEDNFLPGDAKVDQKSLFERPHILNVLLQELESMGVPSGENATQVVRSLEASATFN